jgi:hypothetical protein
LFYYSLFFSYTRKKDKQIAVSRVSGAGLAISSEAA